MIRESRPDEWRAWRAIRLRALAESAAAFGSTYEREAARSDAEWIAWSELRPERAQLVAERDGVPVGIAVPHLEPGDPTRAHLYSMWVAPEARGAGVGRALVAAAAAWVRRRAALDLLLDVTEDNEPARRLYRACGFHDTGERGPLREGSDRFSRSMAQRLPPLVMGIVNVTPDSFSDGGAYVDPAAAIAHGLALRDAGADILDVGGEATNPRAAPIDAAEELRRVLPVVEGLAAAGATVSIDTTKATVARAAVAAGASIVNDVSGGLFDPEMAAAIGALDATYIAGHLRGATIADVFARENALKAPGAAPIGWEEVAAELAARIAALPPRAPGRTWGDPGLGFGKGADPETNLALLRHAGDISRAVRCPIVVGPSRKRFLRRLVDDAQLDVASVTACLGAVRGGAQVLRVHNVALLSPALAVYTRI